MNRVVSRFMVRNEVHVAGDFPVTTENLVPFGEPPRNGVL